MSTQVLPEFLPEGVIKTLNTTNIAKSSSLAEAAVFLVI
jgi:hypothetical protein